jgi:hypothetical protein
MREFCTFEGSDLNVALAFIHFVLAGAIFVLMIPTTSLHFSNEAFADVSERHWSMMRRGIYIPVILALCAAGFAFLDPRVPYWFESFGVLATAGALIFFLSMKRFGWVTPDRLLHQPRRH